MSILERCRFRGVYIHVQSGFYLGIFVWGEAISPQVNTITTTVQSQEYTGGGGSLKFFGEASPLPPTARTLTVYICIHTLYINNVHYTPRKWGLN